MMKSSFVGLRDSTIITTEQKLVVSALLDGVWKPRKSLRPADSSPAFAALRNHTEDMLSPTKDLGIEPSTLSIPSKQLPLLVEHIRPLAKRSIRELLDELTATSPHWSASQNTVQDPSALTKWLVALWLCVEINVASFDHGRTLPQCIADSLPAKHHPKGLRRSFLREDFAAKNLERKADMMIFYTSDLSKHLSFEDRRSRTLFVFRHHCLLEHFSESEENQLFPAGFLTEVRKTLTLLFDPQTEKNKSRVTKLQRRKQVDIEAYMAGYDELHLASYPFFAERLLEIQWRYDAAKPVKLKQWWYDRRNRNEWATLVVAVIIFWLTVIFGVIQSVTGILQVMRD